MLSISTSEFDWLETSDEFVDGDTMDPGFVEAFYLFVAPAYRRRGLGTALLRLLAWWFREQGVQKVCVGVANDSPPEAKPFVEHHGAARLTKHWYAWEEIGAVAR